MHYRRGHAGVAILWKNDINKYVRVLHKEGNKRIMVIKIETNRESLMIINSYMPAGNTTVELTKYQDTRSEIGEIVEKYKQSNTVIWPGDFNGSSTRDKDFGRDIFLNFFCKANKFILQCDLNIPTFHHQSIERSKSRIYHFKVLQGHTRTYNKD